jgi:Ca2+-binding EF-hand superfamily protein
LDLNEVPDFMRALGYFPTEYEIECIVHELHSSGKRKVVFEELVKLYINHAVVSTSSYQMERAIRDLLNLRNVLSNDAVIERSTLIEILTEKSLENNNISRSNAENYLTELFGTTIQIKLNDFLKLILVQEETG